MDRGKGNSFIPPEEDKAMEQAHVVRVGWGIGPMLELDSVRVSLTRSDPEDGAQLTVQVSTDGNDEVSGPDNEPVIFVGLNDATLYDLDEGQTQFKSDLFVGAIKRVQKLRDEAQEYFDTYDVPGEWLDADGSWKDWESESEGSAAESKINTFDIVLDVLQAMAHGIEPAQGAS